MTEHTSTHIDTPTHDEPTRPLLVASYSPEFHSTGVEFDTTVKSRLVAEALLAQGGWALVPPRPVDAGDLRIVHDPEYVQAVLDGTPLALAESNSIGWDEALWLSVTASTGGVVDAVIRALTSGRTTASLSSGLHHARAGSGRGFCTFNGLALAAVMARHQGAQRVLILDLDAHCGGGTASIIDGVDGIEQVDVSTSSFDRYAPRSDARLEITDHTDYLQVVGRVLDEIPNPQGVDLVIYNAGMDVHEGAGGDPGFTTDLVRARERLVLGWADSFGLPLSFTLAGGYSGYGLDMAGVADLHLETFRAAAELAG
jgi:acetoin utilization deacetylase AcuC-like enzyme